MRPLRVLHIASECAPFAKTGGLGDVVGALPIAQRAMGIDARVVIPLYKGIDWNAHSVRRFPSSAKDKSFTSPASAAGAFVDMKTLR